MTDTNTYKARLIEEKTKLESELAPIARPSSENQNEWEATESDTVQEADIHDQADHQDEYQENRAIVDVLNGRYQEVLSSLKQIEDGTYGACEVCGAEIEEERLDADPSAKTCRTHLGAGD